MIKIVRFAPSPHLLNVDCNFPCLSDKNLEGKFLESLSDSNIFSGLVSENTASFNDIHL